MNEFELQKDVQTQVGLAELNLKKEIKEAKKKRNSQLLTLSDSSGKSQISEFGSTTLSSIGSSVTGPHSSDTSFSTSFIRLEDVELPSFWNMTSCEDILHISGVSSTPNQSVFKKTREKIRKAKKANLSLTDPSITSSERYQSAPLRSDEGRGATSSSANESSSLAGNSSTVFAECEKVLEALEPSPESISPNTRLTILDLEKLSDSLIIGTPKSKIQNLGTPKGIGKYPQMSTPKATQGVSADENRGLEMDEKDDLAPRATLNETFERKVSLQVNVENTLGLNEGKDRSKVESRSVFENKLRTVPLNFTFDKGERPVLNSTLDLKDVRIYHLDRVLGVGSDMDKKAVVLDSTFTKKEKGTNLTLVEKGDASSIFDSKTTKENVLNTTFDGTEKVSNTALNSHQNVLNATFDTHMEKEEAPHNRTFEVVGNGSFIIEGKPTTLMDMESNDLQTVLSCTPMKKTQEIGVHGTPTTSLSRQTTTKNPIKSALLKRLSLVGLQPKAIFSREETLEGADRQYPAEQQSGSKENAAVDLTKLESHPNFGPQTKEEGLFRLKKRPAQSITSASGPLKAVPLPKAVEALARRATSTPLHVPESRIDEVLQTGKNCDSNGSWKKEGDKGVLPSFGSVSSIGTDCPNSQEHESESATSTPEVFRPREITDSPRITSTPAMGRGPKFGSDLGLGSAPTPIVAPSSKEELRTFHHHLSSSSEQDKNDIGRLCFSQESSKGETKDPQQRTSSPDSYEKSIIVPDAQRKSSDSVKEEARESKQFSELKPPDEIDTKSEDVKDNQVKMPTSDHKLESSVSFKKQLSCSKSGKLSSTESKGKPVKELSRKLPNRRSESFKNAVSKTQNPPLKSINCSFTTDRKPTLNAERKKCQKNDAKDEEKLSLVKDSESYSKNVPTSTYDSKSSASQENSKILTSKDSHQSNTKPMHNSAGINKSDSAVNLESGKKSVSNSASNRESKKKNSVILNLRKNNLIRPALKCQKNDAKDEEKSSLVKDSESYSKNVPTSTYDSKPSVSQENSKILTSKDSHQSNTKPMHNSAGINKSDSAVNLETGKKSVSNSASNRESKKKKLVILNFRKNNLIRPALKPINTGDINPSIKRKEPFKSFSSTSSCLTGKSTKKQITSHGKIHPVKTASRYPKPRGTGVKAGGGTDELVTNKINPSKASSRVSVHTARAVNSLRSNKENTKVLPSDGVISAIRPRSAIPMPRATRK